MVDTGSVELEPTRQQFVAGTDYNLNTDIVSSAILPGPPESTRGQVARISQQYQQFVDHTLTEGYNAIVRR